MRLSSRLATATAAALLVTGALTGCVPGINSSDGDPRGGSGDGGAVEAGAPGIDRVGKPLTKATFDSPIASGAKIDIAIMGIKVHGKLATLTAQFTPHLPAGSETTHPNLYEMNGEYSIQAALIDNVNLKRYVVVEDSSTTQLQTHEINVRIPNHKTHTFTFTFAAPPESVKKVDVQIGQWPTFRNIPVER
ncbi:MAG TPA: hypothetical protein VIL71_13185 [Spirillospora sp.]